MTKKSAPKQETTERPLCTVRLKRGLAHVPNVKDGKVEGTDLTVSEYLDGLGDTEQVIAIATAHGRFKDFFTDHVEWIHELRLRMPERGTGCKVTVIDMDGNTKTYTWAQFCLKFFLVSSRWVAKLIANYEGMQAQPDIDQPENEEGEKKEKERKPSAEDVEKEYEEKLDRVETQAGNLLLELGSLIAKIEKYKDQIPTELYSAAMNAKFRVVPPILPGDRMEISDIGTDELIDQLRTATKAKAAAAGAEEIEDTDEDDQQE